MKKGVITLLVLVFASICLNIVMASGEEGVVNNISNSGDNVTIEYSSGEKELLEKEINEVVKTDKEKNLMLLGKKLDIAGEAKDLILAAGESIASKAIGSYAFMAASDLEISGEILKDTFAVGNNIRVQGNIDRDLYALGNTIRITGTVERDVFAGGESLYITGNVYGDIKFAGSKVFIDSSAIITGSLDITADSIEIVDGASIGGVVNYRADAQSVSIPNYIQTDVIPVNETVVKTENKFLSKAKSFSWWVISNCILYAVLIGIFPGLFEKIEDIYSTDTVQKCCSSCGWGLLSLIIIPIISILSMLTIIGSAIGIIGILLYILGFIIATAVVGYVISNAVLQNNSNKFLKGCIGILIIEIIRIIPVIGGIAGLIVNAIAFGTVIKLIKASKKDSN